MEPKASFSVVQQFLRRGFGQEQQFSFWQARIPNIHWKISVSAPSRLRVIEAEYPILNVTVHLREKLASRLCSPERGAQARVTVLSEQLRNKKGRLPLESAFVLIKKRNRSYCALFLRILRTTLAPNGTSKSAPAMSVEGSGTAVGVRF